MEILGIWRDFKGIRDRISGVGKSFCYDVEDDGEDGDSDLSRVKFFMNFVFY